MTRPLPWLRWLALPLAVWVGACASPGAGVGADAARSLGTVITPAIPAVAAAPTPLRVSVAVLPWVDARPGAPSRQVGTLKAPVFGVHDNRLVLPRDPSAVMADAVATRLQALGLELRATPAAADLVLEASLQAMALVVDVRDARHVAVQAVLRRGGSGQVLWSGRIEDRDERFAGVAGNNRSDLETYLGSGIGQVADQLGATVARLASDIAAPTPPSPPVAPVPTPGTAPVPTPIPAPVPAPVGRPVPMPVPLPGPAPAPPTAAVPPPAAEGQIAIVTVPARVKVYVGDVYHGLTPLTLELPAGVHVLHFRRDGCPAVTEKVAVRRDRVVELELQLPPC